jgi:hypothetical protein
MGRELFLCEMIPIPFCCRLHWTAEPDLYLGDYVTLPLCQHTYYQGCHMPEVASDSCNKTCFCMARLAFL